ncbi:alpha/beta fold hydrolase [Sandaracinus amylolyticus]|uniref:alpha/beta fold hydrolase n=1 Tax=Sandaracinus amylolyticus TaxID=927083 RepID=UPI001F4539B0|nr:alpha/beta fold hydrolase [Sandaracinus amylolyticus]UJR84430.1 Hypothetical protein I5071_65090 [Sandaracinus amylolyticus]
MAGAQHTELPRTTIPRATLSRAAELDEALARVEQVWHRVLGTREAPRALDAAHHDLDIALIGRLGYYVDAHAKGRPIVLLHGIHAAASAYDVKPLFDAFRGERPVYAPDLPGFGTSERGPNQYCPMLYAKALKRFLVDVVTPREEPVDVVALSLSSEIAARVAIDSPHLFRTLTMISPTGLGSRTPRIDPRRAARIERMLDLPLWASPLYRVLTSRRSVKYFLDKSFHGRAPKAYVDHAVRTARVHGAHHAPFAFVAGQLFTSNARETLYERLRVPTLVLYDRDPHSDFAQLDGLERRNRAVRAHRVPGTRGLPHFERCHEVVQTIRDLQEETRRGEESEIRA